MLPSSNLNLKASHQPPSCHPNLSHPTTPTHTLEPPLPTPPQPRPRPQPPTESQALDKLAAEWESAELEVLPYRDSDTYVIKVDEALLQQLDDHLVMLQSMGFSPHKKPFEERLAKWEVQLRLVSGLLVWWLIGLKRRRDIGGSLNLNTPPTGGTAASRLLTTKPATTPIGLRRDRAMDRAAARLDVPGARICLQRHPAAAAHGGQAVCRRGQGLEEDDGRNTALPWSNKGAPLPGGGGGGDVCFVLGGGGVLGLWLCNVRSKKRACLYPARRIHPNPSPCIAQACCSPKLLDGLTESNKLLETVQKGLADYLETKRLAFSR